MEGGPWPDYKKKVKMWLYKEFGHQKKKNSRGNRGEKDKSNGVI